MNTPTSATSAATRKKNSRHLWNASRIAHPAITVAIASPGMYATRETSLVITSSAGVRCAATARTAWSSSVSGQWCTRTCVVRNPRPIISAVSITHETNTPVTALAPTIQEDIHRHKRVTTLKGYDFPAAIARLNAEEAKPRSKAEIVALLKSEGDRFAGWLESLTPEFLAETFTDPTGQHERTRFESLLGPKEHEMHHRGQLMLIERLLGIVPHLTRLREERVAQHVKNLS